MAPQVVDESEAWAPSLPHLARVRSKNTRLRRRRARCMRSGASAVAGSAGMATSRAPACGPAWHATARSRWAAWRAAGVLSERSLGREKHPLPTIRPNAGLATAAGFGAVRRHASHPRPSRCRPPPRQPGGLAPRPGYRPEALADSAQPFLGTIVGNTGSASAHAT